MSLQNVTLTFKVKKANGSDLTFQTATTTLTTITATAATGNLARQAIQNVIDASIAIGQGNVDDQNEASALFNS